MNLSWGQRLPATLRRVGVELRPPWLTEEVADAIAATRARTGALLEAVPGAIVTADERGRITRVNRAGCELIGADPADLLGRPLAELFSGEWSQQVGRMVSSAGPARTLVSAVECTLANVVGTPVELSLVRTPIDSEVAITAFLTDITRRVADRERMARLVDDLEEARRRAEEANRAKSEFLSRMSHELRTPLNAILGFAQLLVLEAGDDDDCEAVDHILAAGRHLVELIEEVLDISRIEAGRLGLCCERLALAGLVDEAVTLLGPLAERNDVVVSSEVDDGVELVADRRRLLQVMVNLVGNAVKYHPGGGRVEVRARSRTGWVRLEVADDGAGIPPEARDRAFEPFERLGAEASSIEGTGIGLALCRQLVEAMGGRIGLDSEVGVGTVAWVELAAPPEPGDPGGA